MKTMYKTIINGKDVCVNTLDYLGDEVVDGNLLQLYGNDNFIFFFETEEFIDNHVTNYGNGDVNWKTRTTELTCLEFFLDIEQGDNSNIVENRLTTQYAKQITNICNQKYYNVVEI